VPPVLDELRPDEVVVPRWPDVEKVILFRNPRLIVPDHHLQDFMQALKPDWRETSERRYAFSRVEVFTHDGEKVVLHVGQDTGFKTDHFILDKDGLLYRGENGDRLLGLIEKMKKEAWPGREVNPY
jgi:hypothetical protein